MPMPDSWSHTEDGYHFRAGALDGRLSLPADPEEPICLLLATGQDLPAGAFELGPLRWVDLAGKAHEAPILAERLLMAPPTLEIDSLIDTTTGLRLIVRFHAGTAGLDAHFYVQTSESVAKLSLDARFSWQQAELELPNTAGGALVPGTSYDARAKRPGLASGQWQTGARHCDRPDGARSCSRKRVRARSSARVAASPIPTSAGRWRKVC